MTSTTKSNIQRPEDSLENFISTAALANLTDTVETLENNFNETSRDISIINANFSTQQLSIRNLEAGQRQTATTLANINSTLNRLFDTIENLPQPAPQTNETVSDLLSIDSTNDPAPPPLVRRDTSGDDEDTTSHVPGFDQVPVENLIPTAIPVPQNNPPDIGHEATWNNYLRIHKSSAS